MTPGLYTYNVVHADQFIVSIRDAEGTRVYQKVLTGNGDPKTLSAWDWTYDPADGSFLGLYPRAWYTYNIPEQSLVLKCKQISPVLPNNYKVLLKKQSRLLVAHNFPVISLAFKN
jgi:uncharacterized protein (DUF608 family)